MICGEYGGRNAHGEPCQRAAGWGTDAPNGRCMYHAERAPRETAGPESGPNPPDGLSEQAKAVWRSIVSEWVLGEEELLLLQGGLESWDAYRAARAQLSDEGSVVTSSSGSAKRHPAVLIARDSFRDYRECVRQLGLETALPAGDD